MFQDLSEWDILDREVLPRLTRFREGKAVICGEGVEHL